MVGHLFYEYGIGGEFNFGGPKYGWEMQFRKGGRPLADVYPQKGMFTVQIVLGRSATKDASHLGLGRNVRDVFESARELQDGKWLFIPVRTRQDLKDVERLIALKAESLRRRK